MKSDSPMDLQWQYVYSGIQLMCLRRTSPGLSPVKACTGLFGFLPVSHMYTVRLSPELSASGTSLLCSSVQPVRRQSCSAPHWMKIRTRTTEIMCSHLTVLSTGKFRSQKIRYRRPSFLGCCSTDTSIEYPINQTEICQTQLRVISLPNRSPHT